MTNYFSLKNKLNYFLLFLIPFYSSILPQSKSDFALHLMREHDYFRSISIYKELAFWSKNQDSTAYYYSQIGKAYRLSQKYDLSIYTYSNLLSNYRLSDSLSSSIYLNLGLNYLGMNVPIQAMTYFKEAQKYNFCLNSQIPICQLFVSNGFRGSVILLTYLNESTF